MTRGLRRHNRRHRQINLKARAAADRAADANLAAHHAQKLLTDGQAQACAALNHLAAAGLIKRREDAREIFGRDADAGVFDFDAQANRLFAAFGGSFERRRERDGAQAHCHAAGFGERDGVMQQIRQRLPQLAFIGADAARRVGGAFDLKEQPFLCGAQAKGRF